MPNVFTLDLHNHLHEKKTRPKDWWKYAVQSKADAIAITEHPEYNPKDAYEKLNALKPEGIVLIPGVEVTTSVGHLLVFSKTPEIYEIPELLQEGIEFTKALEIAHENDCIASISHPWGFNLDSIGYFYQLSELEKLVRKKKVGVEVYNGMIGHISIFAKDSNLINKPMKFLDFLEKNRIARKAMLGKLAAKLKNKIDKSTYKLIMRSANAVELGKKAAFITAGSDAHSAEKIGTGVLKIKTETKKLTNENVLDEIQHKGNVIWSGPPVREVKPGYFEPIKIPVRKKELLQGIGYTAKRYIGLTAIKEKLSRKKKEPQIVEATTAE